MTDGQMEAVLQIGLTPAWARVPWGGTGNCPEPTLAFGTLSEEIPSDPWTLGFPFLEV